jgi:gas vesicle protein
MKTFLFGLGLGLGLGVLFAPKSGEETRGDIADRANDFASTARDTYEQGRDRVKRSVGALRNVASEAQRPTGTEGAAGI